MRRVSMAVMVAICAVAAACGVPPGDGGSGPLGCAAAPVDLGRGDRIVEVSDDGLTIVVAIFPGDVGGIVYEVIDRAAGTRRPLLTTSPGGDGAELSMDGAGHRIYGYRYPQLAEGETPWFLHDLRLRATEDLPGGIAGFDHVVRFSSDLTRAVVNSPTPGLLWSVVDIDSGRVDDLPLVAQPGWTYGPMSPDLSLVLQYSSTRGFVRSVRVLSTATGAVVRDLGPVRSETEWIVYASFVDDSTVLVTDAVPNGSPSDGIVDDGAFVADVASGRITRLDPGVPGARTSEATPDGARSTYSVIRAQESWIRIGGVNRRLATSFDLRGDADLSTLVSIDDQRVWLHCP